MSATQPYIPRAGERAPRPDRFRTSRRAELKIWWREIDRVLLFLILALMAIGAAAVAAASPASASRLSTSDQQLPDLYFYWAHLRWQLLGLAAMFGAAMLSRENARRAGIVLFAGMFAMLVLVPIAGYEVNGARRWIDLGVSFQPSEFLKPAFVITLAWIIAWRARDPNIPVVAIATAIMGAVGVLLMICLLYTSPSPRD